MSEALRIIAALCAIQHERKHLHAVQLEGRNFVNGTPMPMYEDSLKQREAAAWAEAQNYVNRERDRIRCEQQAAQDRCAPGFTHVPDEELP